MQQRKTTHLLAMNNGTWVRDKRACGSIAPHEDEVESEIRLKHCKTHSYEVSFPGHIQKQVQSRQKCGNIFNQS
jgi:hypothetical protein